MGGKVERERGEVGRRGRGVGGGHKEQRDEGGQKKAKGWAGDMEDRGIRWEPKEQKCIKLH